MVLEDTLELVDDVLVYPGLDVTNWKSEELTFVGYGIQSKQWNDYKKYQGGGTVVFLDGEPTNSSGSSLLTKGGEASEWADGLQRKREVAQNLGAEAVIVLLEDNVYDVRKSRMKRWMLRKSTAIDREKDGEGTNLPTFFVRGSVADNWLVDNKVNSLAEYNQRVVEKNKPSKAAALVPEWSVNVL